MTDDAIYAVILWLALGTGEEQIGPALAALFARLRPNWRRIAKARVASLQATRRAPCGATATAPPRLGSLLAAVLDLVVPTGWTEPSYASPVGAIWKDLTPEMRERWGVLLDAAESVLAADEPPLWTFHGEVYFFPPGR